MKKFWYVSRDPATVGYHDPKTAYFDKAEAKKFAEKMCKKTGHDFYVMEAVALVKQTTPPIEWIEPESVSSGPKRDSFGRFIKADADYDGWLTEDLDDDY